MEIKYLGHSSFLIKTKGARIVTDPFDPNMVGMQMPKKTADIVTLSHDHGDHNNASAVKGEPLVLTWPGEYEKMGVHVTGFATFHDKKQGAERGENVMYKFETKTLSVLHCGDLGHTLTEAQVEEVGAVDILLIPVGGFFTINPEEAVKVVNMIEPSVVIPMHYKHPGLNQETFANLQALDVFLKEIGAEDAKPQDSLKIKKDDLNPEDFEVVTLNIST